MSIVCLGWGSLIWNSGGLPIISNWNHEGPKLPVEFARQSNNGRITLVVTDGAVPLTVFSAVLDTDATDAARAVLAEREGISSSFAHRSVGHWTARSTSDHEEADVIGSWASAAGHDGVVWTALKPKFEQKYLTPTSEQIVQYLGTLAGKTRYEAESYIRRTPTQIRTTYREAIEQALGWTPIVAER